MMHDTKFMLRSRIGSSAAGYGLLSKMLSLRKRGILLDDATDLCIEGYPRCANTFAVLAFQSAQPVKYRIAHHAHLAGHVIQCVRRGLPTIVLIRDPLDAGTSLHMREASLSPRTCLQLYLDFYGALQPYLDRVVVASFDQVVSDYGMVIRMVNKKFGTQYVEYENSDARDAGIFSHIQSSPVMGESDMRICMPKEERTALKEGVRDQFCSKKNEHLVDAAYHIYQVFTQQEGRQREL